jgi:Zn-dependent peptidase ImmA (M78 family)/transcriptional regulator with XRE-family HTH domain
MIKEAVVGVQPSIMRWARESIGMSVQDVAGKLHKQPDEIADWESGASAPTYVQLETLAYNIYKRPIALFFLPSPPLEQQAESEFRTLPNFELNNLASDTHLHIRKGRAYQIALAELFSNNNPADLKIWEALPLSLKQSAKAQALKIRELLGVSIQQQASWNSDEDALKNWRSAIEDRGVFIFKNSFKQNDISGFCLRDHEFPVIYINNGTTKTRQIFSLLHELAHLLFNMNGLSKFDQSYLDRLEISDQKIERFCNAIAAEVLIPSDDFENQIINFPHNLEASPEAVFSLLANRYSVSREAILRRFVDIKRVGKDFYEEKAQEWNSQRTRTSGGSWYSTTKVYLSDRFMKEVFSKYFRHQVTADQAADLLGISTKNLAGLEELALKSAAQ